MSSMLYDKAAVVTGGSRGIGFAIAQELIKNGAKVIICSRTKSEIQQALSNLNNKKTVAHGITCDISKFNDCKKLIRFAQMKLKKIDILVNNAGVYGPIGPFQSLNIKNWDKAFEINFTGMVHLSYLAVLHMLKRGKGKIINLCGAGVGGKSMPNFSAYFTSKFAIAGFTEVLADELKEKNIQVNAISPGAANTYLNDYLIKQGPEKSGQYMYQEALMQKRSGGTPPKLAAELVTYLASDKSDHISGRLLSAKWNPPKDLKRIKPGDNLYKLRRIDQELFYEKK